MVRQTYKIGLLWECEVDSGNKDLAISEATLKLTGELQRAITWINPQKGEVRLSFDLLDVFEPKIKVIK